MKLDAYYARRLARAWSRQFSRAVAVRMAREGAQMAHDAPRWAEYYQIVEAELHALYPAPGEHTP